MTASADSLSSTPTELSFHEVPFKVDMIAFASGFGGYLDWKRCFIMHRVHSSITSVYCSCSDECLLVTGVSICTDSFEVSSPVSTSPFSG